MNNNFCRFILVVLIISSLIKSGCSVIGFRLGAKVDNSRADYKIVKPEDYETVKNSQKITVYLNDNSVMKGKFYGIYEGYLILGSWPDFQRINLDEINSIEIKTTGHGPVKWFGLGIGLAFDYVIVVVLYVAYLISTGNIGT